MFFRRKNREVIAGRLLRMLDAAYLLSVRVLGGREGAESVVQRAYLEALERLESSPAPEDEALWFLGVVVRAGRDHLRDEVVRVARWAAVPPRAVEAACAPQRATGLAGDVRHLVDRLEARHRLPLSLCFEHGLSARDAAVVLGLPESHVERHADDALERLRQALLRRGVEARADEVREALRGVREVAPDSALRAAAAALARPASRMPARSVGARLSYGWRALALISLMLILIGGALLFSRLAAGNLVLFGRPVSAAREEPGAGPE